MLSLKDIDVVILCGGLGKRLRRFAQGNPKALLDINGYAFIDILIGYAASFGFRKFILCVGYKAELIKRHFQEKAPPFLDIIFSQEKPLLGTAGAIKNAQSFLRRNGPFLVLNGDSFCKVDLGKFFNFHFKKKAKISIILTKIKRNAGIGIVDVNKKTCQIISFKEKTKRKDGRFANAGIYIMEKEVLRDIPQNIATSLEYETFPFLVRHKNLYGYITDAPILDIGTPQGLRKSRLYLRKLNLQRK